MRPRPRSIGASALVLSGLSVTLAGCSTGSQESFSTSNLAPRPEQGMYRDEPRRYPDGSTSGGYDPNGSYGRPSAETPRRYVDPGQPTPREIASYNSGHGNIQTGSLGNGSYDPNARWQQPSSGMTTGATAPSPAGYRPPVTRAPHTPQIVEVRQGDTLFSLSRRYNVPVGDLVAANRLPNERIAIGQRLVIPTRYR